MSAVPLDVAFARAQFPALSPDWVLMDNAGGSVTAAAVTYRVADYMRRYQVQLGASYGLSVQAQALVRAGEAAAAALLGTTPDQAIVGPNTTTNLGHVARGIGATLQPGDEVIVTDLDHEANLGCWRKLAAVGAKIREWKLRPQSAALHVEDLLPLLGPRTRVVAFTHCANVVGQIVDVAPIVAAIRQNRADTIVCVDGVAYAPHRHVDVAGLDVDLYALSLYKVYGPHLGVLYGRREVLTAAAGQNHHFVPEDQLPYKFQPGNVTHELAAGLTGIGDYFETLADHHGIDDASPDARRRRVYGLIAEHEQRLSARLLEFLNARADVRVIGPTTADADRRVPTIAFTVEGRHASEIPAALDESQIAIRWGHFYAARAIDALGLADAGGVVRVSMVHYNTLEEVDRLVAALDRIL